MKIVDLICSAGRTGFYFDDQRAIKAGAKSDGFAYVGEPKTAGFTSVRMPGESISVMLVLENGQIAYGDCAAVQYSGCGGRDPLFLAKDFIPIIEKHIKPALIGKEADNFRELSAMLEAITVDGKRLHTAIRYGMTQAILDVVARATGRMMYEVVADEYGCKFEDKELDIFTQSGDDRYTNADKMIIKGAQILPHALINNVKTKLGEHGELLLEYVKWLSDRVLALRTSEDYNPIFHIDVYGTIGAAFGNDNYKGMADYIATLEEAAKPFHLRIEGPMDCDVDRETQMLAASTLRSWPTSGATPSRISSTSPTTRRVTWSRSRPPTSAVSTTPSKPFFTARSAASAPIRAAPATRPTAARRSAYSALWRPVPTRSLQSPAWALTRAT